MDKVKVKFLRSGLAGVVEGVWASGRPNSTLEDAISHFVKMPEAS